MLACIASAALSGVRGSPVSVEVHVSNGLPSFTVVGLPDAACREARDRIRAAILSSRLKWPQQRVTVNLAPSDLRKSGSALDLPMALGVLIASGQIPAEGLAGVGAVGELGLDGSVRPVPGALCLTDAVVAKEVLVPAANGAEAALARPGEVRGVDHLSELVAAIDETGPWPSIVEAAAINDVDDGLRLEQVRGQPFAVWAATVAAAGGHHLLMLGPPGGGKTMLARRICALLPDLDHGAALAAARVASAAGVGTEQGLRHRPPFRAPHHSASMVALVGGGGPMMRPGEISLAHEGVLFLDELGEFPPSVLDALRQPLEEGVIRVSRSARSIELPAAFQLVAAMNPCPCGRGGPEGVCRCSPAARSRYGRRLSGPLLDRFDLRIEVEPADPDLLLAVEPPSPSDARRRVASARARLERDGVRRASDIGPELLDDLAPLAASGRSMLRRAVASGRLSARGLRSVRVVARTLADLGETALPLDDGAVGHALMLRSELPTLREESA